MIGIKKRCAAVTLLWLFAFSAKAQLYIGVEAGANKNYLITGNASESFTDYNSMKGLSGGIPVLYQVTDWFALQADPSFIQKNYKIVRTGFFTGVYQENHNNYIQLPLSAQFSFGSHELRGFVNLGLYGAYWMSSRVKGVEANILNTVDTAYTTVNPTSVLGENYGYSYNQKYQFNNTKDNRLEFGAIAGVGISYELNETYRFFIEGRYTRSLTDQQKQYEINQTPRYNDNVGVSVGCLFALKNLRRGN
jgi:Outer membrane protein beta-barrel domain